jgi:hypothetical protein
VSVCRRFARALFRHPTEYDFTGIFVTYRTILISLTSDKSLAIVNFVKGGTVVTTENSATTATVGIFDLIVTDGIQRFNRIIDIIDNGVNTVNIGNFLAPRFYGRVGTLDTTVLIQPTPTIPTIRMNGTLESFLPKVKKPFFQIIDGKQLIGIILSNRIDGNTGATPEIVAMLKNGLDEIILTIPTTDKDRSFGTSATVPICDLSVTKRTILTVVTILVGRTLATSGQAGITETIGSDRRGLDIFQNNDENRRFATIDVFPTSRTFVIE